MDTQTLVRNLVRQVEDEVAKYPGGHVVSLRVRVGELSGVETRTLSRAYAEAVRNSLLRGTAVTIETEVPDAVCDQCGNKFRFEPGKSECNKCGSMRLSLHGGEQLYLDSVLLED
jgi:Zn finger protein HypA/HybF involved in hydrogenase expression